MCQSSLACPSSSTLMPTSVPPAAMAARGPKRSMMPPVITVIGMPTTQNRVTAPETALVDQPCSRVSDEM